MFDSLSTPQLERLLDQFSVPMSIIERQSAGVDFNISGMNRAFGEQSGLRRDDALGRPITDFTETPEDALAFYQRCVSTRQSVRFSFVFSGEDQRARWDKTLQYCASPNGSDRVLAVALRVPDDMLVMHDRMTLEDLSYFSSIADLQISNLSTAFSTVEDIGFSSSQHQDRMVRLQATCRTIQSTVSDIKRVVQRAQCRNAPPGRHDRTTVADSSPCLSKDARPSTPLALIGSLSARQDRPSG